jgi:hypothetical protein
LALSAEASANMSLRKMTVSIMTGGASVQAGAPGPVADASQPVVVVAVEEGSTEQPTMGKSWESVLVAVVLTVPCVVVVPYDVDSMVSVAVTGSHGSGSDGMLEI